MSLSKMSADLNDIPSVSHLPTISKPPDSFIFKGEETSEMKQKFNLEPELNEYESPLNQEKNLLLERYGVSKDKKQTMRVNLENFQDLPEQIRDDFEISGSYLHKLEKKAIKYKDPDLNLKEAQVNLTQFKLYK